MSCWIPSRWVALLTAWGRRRDVRTVGVAGRLPSSQGWLWQDLLRLCDLEQDACSHHLLALALADDRAHLAWLCSAETTLFGLRLGFCGQDCLASLLAGWTEMDKASLWEAAATMESGPTVFRPFQGSKGPSRVPGPL